MIFIPKPEDFPKLTTEEEKLPIAKYYYKPLSPLNPVYERALRAPALTPKEIPNPEDWVELVQAEGYNDSDFGYGMMENGAGYLATYSVTYVPPEMSEWWFQWMQVKPKSMPEGRGNIRYKIWCPPDHFESDGSKNVGTESLDLGQGDPKEDISNYSLDLFEAGMSKEKYEALKAAGVTVRLGYEKFDHPGTHITFRYQRPLSTGGIEEFGREWLGYKFENGKFVRDEETPCTEEYLRKIVIHNQLEGRRLQEILPDIYRQYHDKPMDAD